MLKLNLTEALGVADLIKWAAKTIVAKEIQQKMVDAKDDTSSNRGDSKKHPYLIKKDIYNGLEEMFG